MTATKQRRANSESPTERIVNDDPVLHEDFPPGTATHQGDIMIVAIDQKPRSARPRRDRQLAIGNTQGSRHVMTRGEIFDADASELMELIRVATKRAGREIRVEAEYIGLGFVSPENPTCDDLDHPEHGNKGFEAGRVCAVVYQRNLDAEERAVRSRD